MRRLAIPVILAIALMIGCSDNDSNPAGPGDNIPQDGEVIFVSTDSSQWNVDPPECYKFNKGDFTFYQSSFWTSTGTAYPHDTLDFSGYNRVTISMSIDITYSYHDNPFHFSLFHVTAGSTYTIHNVKYDMILSDTTLQFSFDIDSCSYWTDVLTIFGFKTNLHPITVHDYTVTGERIGEE